VQSRWIIRAKKCTNMRICVIEIFIILLFWLLKVRDRHKPLFTARCCHSRGIRFELPTLIDVAGGFSRSNRVCIRVEWKLHHAASHRACSFFFVATITQMTPGHDRLFILIASAFITEGIILFVRNFRNRKSLHAVIATLFLAQFGSRIGSVIGERFPRRVL